MGFATFPAEPILGLKRVLLPVSYWRTVEFAYVLRTLALAKGARVLDLGSPKDLSLIIAREYAAEVTATDILPSAVNLAMRYASALRIAGQGHGRVTGAVQDGRSLSFADNSFDAAFSVSVVEHIPGHGDSDAVRELVRVVKPGGLLAITTPFDTRYRETFVDRDVYERHSSGMTPVFFERHHDWQSLHDRLIVPSGAKLIDLELWGEKPGRSMEHFFARHPKIRIALSPLEAAFASRFLVKTTRESGIAAKAVFFTLQKQPAS
jgi:SAM-dependent methyltransferase